MNDSRRGLLAKGAAGVSALAGIGWVTQRSIDSSGEGNDMLPPPARPDEEWTLRFDEQWDGFDDSRWARNFIVDGDVVPDDDATVSGDHVVVEGNQCRLQVQSEGTGPDGCYQGVINSSTYGLDWHPHEGVPVNPDEGGGGQYMEARLKLPGRTGVLPGFWSMPANTNWPPEIDIVELFQRGNDPESERRTFQTDAHWTWSTEPGDRDTHAHETRSTDTGIDLTETFNTFGCAWFEDRLEWYFNGDHIHTRDGPDELFATLNHGAAHPFGMVFSNHVNRVGEANLDEEWMAEMVIDWVHVWDRTEGPANSDESG